jgi:folylpolyglutamate synthase/dihydropteroate synthase
VHRDEHGIPLVIDGAHTETSLAAVAAELQRRWPGRTWTVLFASAAGKRWREGLRALLPLADRFHVTEVSGTTSEDPLVVAQWLRDRQRVAVVEPGAAAGLAALLQHRGPRLVVGSFYLAGQVRRLLREQQGPAQNE